MKQPKVGLIGVPFSKGQPKAGAELGPGALRAAGLIDKIEAYGKKVHDHGDIEIEVIEHDPPFDHIKNPRNVGRTNQNLAAQVALVTKTEVGLVLGGDHSIGVGSIFGDAQTNPDLVVLWVDAHADINTPETTTSGNIHGMPLSFLIKEFQDPSSDGLPGFEWVKPCISAKDVVHIGLRDVDGPERILMNMHGVKSYSMHDVETHGIAKVLNMALQSLDSSGNRPIHVSLDVDSVDPAYTPSTGTSVTGGLTLREAFFIGEEIAKTGRLSVLDVVEVNPLIGTEEAANLTAQSAVDIAAHFFGKRREGNPIRG